MSEQHGRTRKRAADQLLYDRKGAADKIGISVDTLDRWHRDGLIPMREPKPGSPSAYYYIRDIEDAIERMGLR